MPEDTNNTAPNSVKISEEDLKVIRQAHGLVAKRLAELGSSVRQLEVIKRETAKLVDAQAAKVGQAHAEVEQAEQVFQSFLTMVASKYSTPDGKPQIDLNSGVVSFG